MKASRVDKLQVELNGQRERLEDLTRAQSKLKVSSESAVMCIHTNVHVHHAYACTSPSSSSSSSFPPPPLLSPPSSPLLSTLLDLQEFKSRNEVAMQAKVRLEDEVESLMTKLAQLSETIMLLSTLAYITRE